MPLSVGQHGEAAEEDECGDGQVHVEAPAPVDVLGQEATEDQPEGGPRDGDGRVNPEGPPPFPRVGEGRGQQRQHGGRQQCAEEALQTAGADQHERGLGRPTDSRGQGEAEDAGHERALRPEHVADAATEQEEAAERQCVGRDDPLPIGVGEPEGMLRRGEGDDHDRRIEHHHELGAGDDDEDPPVGPGRCSCAAPALRSCSVVTGPAPREPVLAPVGASPQCGRPGSG